MFLHFPFYFLHDPDCSAEADVFPLHISADERLCPAEKPLRFVAGHVHTAVAHRHSEIVMPVSAMEGDPGFRYEITTPGRPREFIGIRVVRHLSLSHMMGRHLVHDVIVTLRR